MLFRLKHGADPFELNPGAKAVPEFDALTDKQFIFTCLVADVASPLRTLPEEQRRTRAAALAGYGMEGNRPDKNARNLIGAKIASVEIAINAYKQIQYDEDQANLAAVERQILEIRNFLEKDKSEMYKDDFKAHQAALKLAITLGQELPKLAATKKEIERIIKSKSSPNIGIQTNTAADITEEEQQQLDDPDEQVSTLDLVMAKERTNATDRQEQ